MSSRTAFVLIDTQVNMFDPTHPVAGADDLLARLADLLARARAARMPIAFVRNCGGPLDPDVRGTPGWEIHPDLRPLDGELVFDKTTCNAFETTSLGEELRARGIKRLVVAGLQSEFCVRDTTLGALDRGFEVTLISNGHSTYDAGDIPAAEVTATVNAELGGRVRLEMAHEANLG